MRSHCRRDSVVLIAALFLAACTPTNTLPTKPVYIRNWSQYDVNEVWLARGAGPNNPPIRTRLTSDLSPLAAQGVDYNNEILEQIPMRHDPSTNPIPTPYYTVDYIQETVRFNGQPQYTPLPGRSSTAFAPGVNHVSGYTLVRETMFIFNSSTRFEQMLQGPDGNLYLYRPGADFIGHPEVVHGPILLQTLINEGYTAYAPSQRGP